MNMNIKGESIESISFDFAVSFRTDKGTELRLETGFELQNPEGNVLWIAPPDFDGADELIHALLHTRIEGAETDPAGILRLRLRNDARISVAPSPDYEAWTLNRSDGTMLTSTPGGETISWGSLERE